MYFLHKFHSKTADLERLKVLTKFKRILKRPQLENYVSRETQIFVFQLNSAIINN